MERITYTRPDGRTDSAPVYYITSPADREALTARRRAERPRERLELFWFYVGRAAERMPFVPALMGDSA